MSILSRERRCINPPARVIAHLRQHQPNTAPLLRTDHTVPRATRPKVQTCSTNGGNPQHMRRRPRPPSAGTTVEGCRNTPATGDPPAPTRSPPSKSKRKGVEYGSFWSAKSNPKTCAATFSTPRPGQLKRNETTETLLASLVRCLGIGADPHIPERENPPPLGRGSRPSVGPTHMAERPRRGAQEKNPNATVRMGHFPVPWGPFRPKT